jgi:hypothetical protein
VGAEGESIDSPVPVGESAEVGKWRIEVVGLTRNADTAIHNENQFNARPKDGFQYLMITLKSTYTGSGSGSAYFEQVWSLISADGTSYGDTDAVLPNDLINANSIPSGANVVGNIAFLVPSAKVGGMTLYIEADTAGFSTQGAFFALS